MSNTPDQIARRILTTERTRWEGQEPRDDEVLAAAYEALRERVADLELLWRAAYGCKCSVFFEGPGIAAFGRTPNRWSFQRWNGSNTDPEYTDLCEPVPDDGTGLPVLTDEARAALRGEVGT